jgi:hypothetical protein
VSSQPADSSGFAGAQKTTEHDEANGHGEMGKS